MLDHIPTCSLDPDRLRAQRGRYAALAAHALHVARDGSEVLVTFDPDYDRAMLRAAVALERECCPFFRFALDAERRELRVTVDDDAMLPGLDAIASAFRARPGSGC